MGVFLWARYPCTVSHQRQEHAKHSIIGGERKGVSDSAQVQGLLVNKDTHRHRVLR